MQTQDILSTIGNTPLINLSLPGLDLRAKLFAKQESRNPLGSIKDRVALSMVEAGIAEKTITSNSIIIEPTSGNTGLGLALVCASKKLRLVLTMPETMSMERQKLLKHLGAELILTPGETGMKGAVEAAEQQRKEIPGSVILNQFSNPACSEIHRKTTGPEIWEQTGGKIDYFVAGVGTGGTITGVSEYIKEKNPQLRSIAVEPDQSPVLSGGKAGPHAIQGIGAGFIPKVLNQEIIDEIVRVTNEEALAASRLLALRAGILCGISSGAAVWAAIQIAARHEAEGKNIVTVLPDTGERYISTKLVAE